MSGKPDWRIVLGLLAFSLVGCDRDASQIAELPKQVAQLQAQAAEGKQALADLQSLHEGRTNLLILSFEKSKFNLGRVPVVQPGQDLMVEVDWDNNPDGWDSVVLHDFKDRDGNRIDTMPPTLELQPGGPEMPIRMLTGKRGPWVYYTVSYSRTVKGQKETWSIDPEWERWP